MATKTLEERILQLEKSEEELKKEVRRLRDVNEISNLMCMYEYKMTGGRFEDVVGMFALKQPDVRAEMKWGVYEGAEAIKKLYLIIHKDLMKIGATPGGMPMLPNTSPVIEVAEDGRTAKGLWTCPGIDTGNYGQPVRPFANWAWAKRGTDFIKEDGKWKIWHYHVYAVFFTRFDVPWTEGDAHPPAEFPPELRATRPPTCDTGYAIDKIIPYLPEAPEPYTTFEQSKAY